MATAADILTFLRDRAQATILADGADIGRIEITGVTTDSAAQSGELAWISPRNVSRFPERFGQFNGTILIGPPAEGRWQLSPSRAYVECPDPKGALTAVVDAFFRNLTITTWPSVNPAAVSADARIGDRVSLAAGVVIGGNVTIEDDVVIGPNTCIANARIESNVRIGANCSIGLAGFGYSKGPDGSYARFPHLGRVLIEADVEVGSNTCIDRGSLGETILGRGSKIDNLVHIAHNVVLGRNVTVIANAMIGGSTTINDQAWVAPSVAVMDGVTIGQNALLGLGAVVLKSVPEGAVFIGNPARPLERQTRGEQRG